MKALILLVALLSLNRAFGQGIGTNLVVETFAGSEFSGHLDGQGTRSMFNGPQSLAITPDGMLYCSEGALIRAISPEALVTTIGTPVSNSISQLLTGEYGDLIVVDGSLTAFRYSKGAFQRLFTSPGRIAWNQTAKTYFAPGREQSFNKILKFDGSRFIDFVGSGNGGEIDGDGVFSSFSYPNSIAVAPSGDMFVGDQYAARKVTLDGIVTTVGQVDAYPSVLTILPTGVLLVAKASWISAVGIDGKVTPFAGGDQRGFADGPIGSARFTEITGMVLGANGDLFLSDSGNNRIRRIRSVAPSFQPDIPSAAISLLAGVTITGIPGRFYSIESSSDANGPWVKEAAIQLPKSPFTWIDSKPVAGPRKFYRAVGLN